MSNWSRPFLAVLLAAGLASAQSSSPRTQPEKGKKKPKASAVQEAENERRALALVQVREFAGRIAAFQDAWTRNLTTARLAGVLWEYDQPFARQLFSKALDLPAVENGAKPEKNKLTGRDVAELRRLILGEISRRDAALAKRLAEEQPERDAENAGFVDNAKADIGIAYEFMEDDYKKASEVAGRSLQEGVSPFIAGFLKQLRQKDANAANDLFRQALGRLVAQPAVDGNTLLLLGTYVFTSPRVDSTDPLVIAQVGVGRVMVPDISAERPGVPPELVRLYIAAAARILSRPVADTKQKQLYYVTGQLLLPKAHRFAPDLVSVISAAMQTMAADVPPALTQPSSYEHLSNYTPKSFEESLREAEKSPSDEARDLRYLTLVFDLWRRQEFTPARSLAAKVSDKDARAGLEVVIDFGEAAGLLEKHEVAAAEERANKLPQGVERALLWLAIGGSAARSGDSQRANEAINQALKAAASVPDARRPFLMVAAAGQLARYDATRANAILTEAVQEFNKQESKALAGVDWRRRVEVGKLWRNFPLSVKGAEVKFERALPSLLTPGDPQPVIFAVSQLTDEPLLARALVTIAATMLKPLMYGARVGNTEKLILLMLAPATLYLLPLVRRRAPSKAPFYVLGLIALWSTSTTLNPYLDHSVGVLNVVGRIDSLAYLQVALLASGLVWLAPRGRLKFIAAAALVTFSLFARTADPLPKGLDENYLSFRATLLQTLLPEPVGALILDRPAISFGCVAKTTLRQTSSHETE